MADLVVTVPKHLWLDWIEEGDLPGEPWGGDYWSYYTGGSLPKSLKLSGVKWDPGAFYPSETSDPDRHSPGTELVWNNLAADDRQWWLVEPDQRCYIVAHGRLRGYAPLFAIETDETGRQLKALIRRGGAVAVTIPGAIPGFRGWRYRWWDRTAEVDFPEWKAA